MRVLFWVTNMNGEILALLRHMLSSGKHEVMVAHDTWDRFSSEAHQHLIPIRPPRIVRRTSLSDMIEIQRFKADVAVVDNVLPKVPVSRAIFVIWHGFAGKWMLRHEIDAYARKLLPLVGRIDRKNPRFIWKAYGTVDLERQALLGINPANISVLGMAAADDVRMAMKHVSRDAAQPFYSIDLSKRVILLAPTWHYGGVFSHWTDETTGFERLFAFARDMDASVLVRMHDRKRYPAAFLADLNSLVSRYGNVQLRFKDEGEDNLVDMAVSDVMLTNYSSIGVLYHVTGRPAVHIYPFTDDGPWIKWRKFDGKRVRVLGQAKVEDLFLMPLEKAGGPVVRSMDSMLSTVEESLREPERYRSMAYGFLDEYIPSWRSDVCPSMESFLEERFASPRSIVWPVVDAWTSRDVTGGLLDYAKDSAVDALRNFLNKIKWL